MKKRPKTLIMVTLQSSCFNLQYLQCDQDQNITSHEKVTNCIVVYPFKGKQLPTSCFPETRSMLYSIVYC